MILLTTVIGPYSDIVYGEAGDEVELIARHDNMAIVAKGKARFPVKFEILSEEKPTEQTTIQEAVPVVAKITVPSRTKKKSARPVNQNQPPSLF